MLPLLHFHITLKAIKCYLLSIPSLCMLEDT
ncbi:hypothetical protein WwAna1324, partial [Wolbachia endosymbiont of Drosophila ananassae]